MAKTYVIADIHGRLDLLEAALARIEENTPAKLCLRGISSTAARKAEGLWQG